MSTGLGWTQRAALTLIADVDDFVRDQDDLQRMFGFSRQRAAALVNGLIMREHVTAKCERFGAPVYLRIATDEDIAKRRERLAEMQRWRDERDAKEAARRQAIRDHQIRLEHGLKDWEPLPS